MRHSKLNKRFGRNQTARKELLRSLARNTIIYSSIKTTLSKAKEASRLVDKLITLGKESTLHSRRAAFDVLRDRTMVSRLFNDLAPLFNNRKGGYTRIIKTNNRHGDGTQMAVLELVERIEKKAKPKKDIKPKQPKVKQKPKEVKEEKLAKPKLEKSEQKPKPAVKEKPKAVPTGRQEISQKPKEEPKKEGWLGKLKGMFKKKKD